MHSAGRSVRIWRSVRDRTTRAIVILATVAAAGAAATAAQDHDAAAVLIDNDRDLTSLDD